MPPVEPTLKTLCSVNLKTRFFMQITYRRKEKNCFTMEKQKQRVS